MKGSGHFGAEEGLGEGEADAGREAVVRPSVLTGVANAFDGGGIAQQIAHAGDEAPHSVLGVGALRPRAPGGAEDLVGAEPFLGAAEELYDQRLEGPAPLERDLAVVHAQV